MADDPLSDFELGGSFTRWVPLIGEWTLTDDKAVYNGDQTEQAYGLLRAPDSLGVTAGMVSCVMRFSADADLEAQPQGRIVFGFNPRTGHHYSAGLGGFGSLYSIEQFIPGQGWSPISNGGTQSALPMDRPITVVLRLGGQSAALDVDDVTVFDVQLPAPLESPYLGLVARGRSPVYFREFEPEGMDPEAFIVMQFGEPFDALYAEVIAPVCEEMGYAPTRADEFAGPGLILSDIIEGIRGATVVIAEVTPVNANVYFELGYATAIGKPTILLADKEQLRQLPFDISGFRCIFYNDSIGGKQKVEVDLRRHLAGATYSS